MEKSLNILLVEDYPSDAELVKRNLSRAGLRYAYQVVETRSTYIKALNEFKPDLILSDYTMPSFNGMDALVIRKDLAPHIPFILVTGSLNEDVAVECMKAGADDYVIKENLTRLVPSIEAAILKQENIKKKLQAEQALYESEKKFRKLFTNMNEGVCLFRLVFDKNGVPINYKIVEVNRQFEKIISTPENRIIGKLGNELTHFPLPFNLAEYKKVANEETGLLFETEYEPLKKKLLISVSPWEAGGFAAIVTDITPITNHI